MPNIMFLVLMVSNAVFALQAPYTSAVPDIKKPTYHKAGGPIICIDAAHNNLHTIDRGFAPFAAYLEQDGYRMQSVNKKINSGILDNCSILVIANALHESNLRNWTLPTPSAFTGHEIKNIKAWVVDGGSLFLIADHMPYPGANEKLAAAFGFTFNNGFAMKQQQTWPPAVFKKSANTLQSTRITQGIDSVASYTGQAFQIPNNAIPVLTFGDDHYSLMPDTAWQFSAQTPQNLVMGWSQGAIMDDEKGRLAVFGEAAMFTAQTVESQNLKVGLIDPNAPQNARFLLNIIHWLDRELKQKSQISNNK